MPSTRNPDFIDHNRSMMQRIRDLEIAAPEGGGTPEIYEYMHLTNVSDGGLVNNVWTIDGYSPSASPDYPDGIQLGVLRIGPMIHWEGALFFNSSSGDPATARNLINSSIAGKLPAPFRAANFTQLTITSDVNNTSAQDNVFTTFQAAVDGFIGFGDFVYFDALGPAMTGAAAHDRPRNFVALNLDGISYRGGPLP